MTKLISGRVAKVPSANVSANRYEFIDLSETEPDLGLPSGVGYVLTSTPAGVRSWVNPIEFALTANTSLRSGVANVALLANSANTVLSLSNFTTANLVEGINLYFTNARVISAVTPLLTTGNVVETTNQYFTNARVTGALVRSNVYVQNLIANDTLFANALILQNINVTSNIISGTVVTSTTTSNTIVADSVTSNTWNRLYTANVIETSGNLYFTPARVNATVQPFLTTANVIETSGNLYFTTARVNTVVQPFLTTANVVESASNLYFTNVRVIDSLVNSNVYVKNLIANDTLYANALILQNINVTSNIISGTVSSQTSTSNIILADSVTSNTWNRLYSSNVIENTNLFFTNARAVVAITPLLTTSNVAEGSNLYFTAARVNATVQPFLTTANVREVSGNLYFTNSRVVSALIAGQNITIEANGRISSASTTAASLNLTTADVRETSNLYFTNTRVLVGITTGTVVGNIISTGKITADILAANSINVGSGVGGSITDANLISATYIQANTWLGLYTANVVESPTNLYFTTARVNATVQPFLTTANVIETGANLYFTNTRVRSALSNSTGVYYNSSSGQFSIGQDVATTSNVIFANVSVTGTINSNSLNAIGGDILVKGNILPSLDSVFSLGSFTNKWKDLYLYTTSLYLGNTKVSSNTDTGGLAVTSPSGAAADLSTANLFATGLIYGDVVGRVSNLYNHTTSNLREGVNQYFTNVRVLQAVNPLLTTSNVAELTNLYFTNARVILAVTPLLTTANIIESTNNLYYTNSRVRSAISGGTGVTVNSSTGEISIGQDVSTTANVTFYNLSVTNNLVVYGGVERFLANNLVVSDNMIYLNSNSINSNPDLGIAFNYNDGVYHHAGFFRDHSDGSFKVFDNYTPEPDANIFIDTAHASFRLANLRATNYIGNVTGFVTGQVSSLDNLNTSALKEGSNLYFTNARVVSALIAGQNIIIEANGRISANITTTIANLQSQISNLSTDQIGEGAVNLYYTNSRVVSVVTPKLTTANVIETSGNLYFTNSRVVSAITAGDNIIIEANGRISANVSLSIANLQSQLSNLTTDNITEGNTNKYFTNSRTIVAITPLLTTSNVAEGSNLYFTAARVNATVQPFLTTANVIETSGNLYFTNARVVSALVAGQNIVIEANGRISANSTTAASLNLTTADVRETSNLYFTNARVLVGITTGTVVGNITATGIVTANIISANIVTIGTGTGGTISGFANITATGTITANIINANIIILQNINVTSNIITGTVSSGTTTSNIIVADSVTSNTWNRLYTANVIETSGNLYFTNARVVTAITPLLTTSNVVEGSNLYFTNARVLVGITTGTVVGNITATGIVTANIISANIVTIGTGTGGTISGFANITATGTITTNILSANTLSIGAGAGGTIAGANLISATYIQGTNWLGLYTSNVVETSSNLYFTNARVVSALIAGQNITIEANGRISSAANSTATVTAVLPYLTTSNVAEGSNLYFTNSRVLTGITTGTVVGNITVTGIVTANILNANTLSIGAGGTLTGLANITATDTITANTLRANNIILQNINVTSNIITGTVSSGTSTSNIIVADSVTSNTWNRLYTANVIETSGNLYFTNARVLVGITTGTVVGNITATGTITANILSANTLSIGAGAGGTLTGIANIVVTNTVTTNIMSANTLSIGTGTGGTIAGANLISTTYIQANSWLGLYTSNVIESPTNLFFTNARVVSALIAGQNITIEANGRISSTANSTATVTAVLPYLTTSNVAEGSNLYFTTARVNTTVQPFLTTANVIETSSNLYFTNARVLVGIATGTVVGNITATGIITANIISANVGIFGSGSGGSLLGANIISAGTISANLLLTNVLIANAAILGSGVGGSLTGANLLSTITIQANSWLGLYTANVVESPTNLFFTNARVNATVQPFLTTANVIETSGNLYFTTARVNTTVQPFLTTANVIETSGNLYFTTARVNATVQPFLTTANVIETSGNLYFTNARVINALVNSNVQVQNLYANSTIYANTIVLQNINVTSNIISGSVSASTTTSNTIVADSVTSNTWNRLYTANVIETTGNLYFTNARVIAGLVNSNIQVQNLYANSTVYANALIIQNVNVTSTVLAGNITSGTSTSNTIVADSVTSNTWNRLYTANVIETGGNLYFTNTRVVSALIAGENVTIEANGRISAPLPISVINDSYRFISTGNTTYNIGTSVNDPKNVLVIVEGLIQLPVVDYTVSSTSLIFTEPPTNGTNVEVRFFGIDTINSGRALTSDINAFIGNGSSVNYTLSSTPPNKNFVSIIIDGVYQQSDSYTLSGKTIILSEAPAVGANIDIRVIGGIAGSSYNTRTFTGNGTSNTFALSEGFNKDTVLVFENGVAQMPTIDYDIVNDSLVFTTPPAANIVVQVRELGIPSLSVANVLASVRGLDQTVGNLVPTVGVSKNLGSSASPFNQLYLSSNVVLSGAGTTLYITGGGTTQQVATAASVSAKAFGLSLIFGG